MDTVTMAFMFRGITILMVCGGAIMSIYLGWKLYRDGINSPVTSELSNGGKLRFTLKALGPGVFFAAFGMWVLVEIVSNKTVFEPAGSTEEAEEVGLIQLGKPSRLALIPTALANPKQKRSKVCFPLNNMRLASYDGENPQQSDFDAAITDSVDLLRKGAFKAQDSERVNKAIAILSRLAPPPKSAR